MREILFRAKRVDNGEWVEGYYIRYGWTGEIKDRIIPAGASALYAYEVDPSTVGQYTGLTDKNGKRIFEGDIVKENSDKIGYIAFLIQAAGYVIVWKNTDTRLGHRTRQSGYENDETLEVIGSIHDNPELLEVHHD